MEEKTEEDRKYIIFNTDSIKTFSEASGNTNIDEKVYLLLSEDISYRIREVVNNAAQIMKHSKRKKLTTNDINKSLKWSHCKPVYGYSDETKTGSVVHIPEANVFCVEDKELDVLATACQIVGTNEEVELKNVSPHLSVDWLSVEGKIKDSCLDGNVHESVNEDSRVIINYYETVALTVLNGDKVAFNAILRDVATNSRVQRILSHLISFISLCIKRLSNDLKLLRRFILLITSLFKNRHLYLYTEPYLLMLTHSVLFCVIEPLTSQSNPSSDHWSLRESSAYFLADILSEWNSPFIASSAVNMIVNTLVDCIKDTTKPFASHFGVIVTFKALGYEYIEEYLFPNMKNFVSHLSVALNNDNISYAKTKMDAQKVYGALWDVSVLYLQVSAINALSGSSNDCNSIYDQFSDYFGDSLSACIAIDCEKLCKLLYKKRSPEVVTHLFASTEREQTGEQLLDAFYEIPFEESHSNSCGSNYNSEDDHSMESEVDKERITIDGDLLIKSTISDPTLGIKLTIKKVRRAQESSDSDSTTKSSKRKKAVKKYKEPCEPVFEECCLKSRIIRISIPGNHYFASRPTTNGNHYVSF
ncbi:TAF6-like RNA polymerase II p300/CBP-associated factor-associated factor 65 kDa subunit 6L [Leptotrombidium deliense]|uniref:TAF6-like RNA polymerase II p300/CBP-associated factor-associated factor 65 kDa subunit 6L n=1 Tax=Leptotrombidium deliense TaxID=299467 RepID=A0A443SJ86_9ACAR|nr:TAF6-like RNA polymerase II p300/CBP-associated factor-associated factor 65 kDa subunit 6L [Leptotrombidium deliense]